jgi:hypothetical protein
MMAVLCVVMAVALSGCGGSGVPVDWDDTAERANLIRAANSWITGIEAYDIDGMAGDNILAAGFVLTITENGASPTKDREQLIAELIADAVNQEDFRMDSGYTLRLDIDSDPTADAGYDTENAWTVLEISQYEADVTAFFEVFEEATDVPRWRSDSGQISMHFIRTYGAWKILTMEIKFGAAFYPGGYGYRTAAGAVAGPRAGGFGF